MTPGERRKPVIIKASRKQRVAKGSGTSVQEINRLLKQFQEASRMMKKVSKLEKKGKLPGGLGGLLPGGGGGGLPPGFPGPGGGGFKP
jgi:signal recognition particle subunit SRP54